MGIGAEPKAIEHERGEMKLPPGAGDGVEGVKGKL